MTVNIQAYEKGHMNRLFRVDGCVAVVTGGAGRIGRMLSLALADAGAKVCVLDLDEMAGREVAEQCNRLNEGNSLAIAADTCDESQLSEAVERISGQLGTPEILVNSTQFRGQGFYSSDPSDYPRDAWDKVMTVNLTGVLAACQAFGRAMIAGGGGAIANLASTYGVVSPDPRIYGNSGVNSPISYGASKAAVIQLTRYLAVHWREQRIRVNCLVPGGVFDKQGEEFVNEYCARTPLGRMARAEEYQGAVLFMVSEASSYMTGSVVTVDGGWTAW